MTSSSTSPSESIDCKINIPVEIFNIHFTCPLCLGYFRDPYTITECGMTFCKACLLVKLKDHQRCPKPGCAVLVTQKNGEYQGVGRDREKDLILDYAFPDRKAEVKNDYLNWYRSRDFKTKKEKAMEDQKRAEEEVAMARDESQARTFNSEDSLQLKLKLGIKRPLPEEFLDDDKVIIDARASVLVAENKRLPQIHRSKLKIPLDKTLKTLAKHIAQKLQDELWPTAEHYLIAFRICFASEGDPPYGEDEAIVPLDKSKTLREIFHGIDLSKQITQRLEYFSNAVIPAPPPPQLLSADSETVASSSDP